MHAGWELDEMGRGEEVGASNLEMDAEGSGLVGALIGSLDGCSDDDSEDLEGTALSVLNPEPYLSHQFFTFNRESHRLMARCILLSRYPTPEEIRSVTPVSVLASWRGVWKDRNEDTAYSTGWKRIQDKLGAVPSEDGPDTLFFKNNPNQLVPHMNQWQEIAMSCHSNGLGSKHLSFKETLDKIKQVWTVGAKFYGIQEAFVRACVLNCSVCRSGEFTEAHGRSKRRRFKYTDTFEVPAKEVPQRLQQLAAKHKVVLCIRQKYIRYKPFMAEVKDYCCHRAGEPNAKKSSVLQRKRYISKRCGCGFRIRAIVPIKDYNQKDKTFAYEDDGNAVFNLYAVHSGHEPGPHEGSARIIHRFVGPANLAIERGEIVYMDGEGADWKCSPVVSNEDTVTPVTILRQIAELKAELVGLASKIPGLSKEALGSLSRDLVGINQQVRGIWEASHFKSVVVSDQGQEALFLNDSNNLDGWGDCNELKESIDAGQLMNDSHGHDFMSVVDSMSHRSMSIPLRVDDKGFSHADCVDNLKLGDWNLSVKGPCEQFTDDKPILLDGDLKICREPPLTIGGEDDNLVDIHVDGYYNDSLKWYLDPNPDCGDNLSISMEGFRHAIV